MILPPDLGTEVIGLFALHVLGDFLRFLRLVRQSMRGLMFSVELRLDLNFMFERVGHRLDSLVSLVSLLQTCSVVKFPKNVTSNLLDLFIISINDLLLHAVELVVELIYLVSQVRLCNLVASNDLCDENELNRIRHVISLSKSKDGVLHQGDLQDLLFVACLCPLFTDSSESLADNRDEQVEEQDNVEDSAKHEDKPVCFAIDGKVFVELSKGRQERNLPVANVRR